ncbi:MAG: MgtC/SapB family protein [Oscillatoriales cyanobacterium C42_A2020_001]|nr:MgtC/SapB family protein [Leptolyngbyaceae cyanobacterium C42_A2020_001]
MAFPVATSAEMLAVSSDNWIEISLRLGLAVLLGGTVGWDRQISGKAGGLRTHMLVSLGAALFVMVPLQTGASPGELGRAIQGIATGIGFLGAGEIVHRSLDTGKLKVKGLTSAASIWVTAALGVMAGCGLWRISVIATLLTLFILVLAKRLERYLPDAED